MNRQILQGDILEKLVEITDESIDCIISSPPYWGLRKLINNNMDKLFMRNKKTGRFKKKFTWREERPYWEKGFLVKEYTQNLKSASQIALEQHCKENNILYFIKKFKIKTRTTSQTRKVKYWGLKGSKNPMFGKFGKDSPNWNGGHSNERQCMYARSFWKELRKLVLKRDNYKCQKCFADKKLTVHHILPWSKYPKYKSQRLFEF